MLLILLSVFIVIALLPASAFIVFFEFGFVIVPPVDFSLVVEILVVDSGSQLDYLLKGFGSVELIDFVGDVGFESVVEKYNKRLLAELRLSGLDPEYRRVLRNRGLLA